MDHRPQSSQSSQLSSSNTEGTKRRRVNSASTQRHYYNNSNNIYNPQQSVGTELTQQDEPSNGPSGGIGIPSEGQEQQFQQQEQLSRKQSNQRKKLKQHQSFSHYSQDDSTDELNRRTGSSWYRRHRELMQIEGENLQIAKKIAFCKPQIGNMDQWNQHFIDFKKNSNLCSSQVPQKNPQVLLVSSANSNSSRLMQQQQPQHVQPLSESVQVSKLGSQTQLNNNKQSREEENQNNIHSNSQLQLSSQLQQQLDQIRQSSASLLQESTVKLTGRQLPVVYTQEYVAMRNSSYTSRSPSKKTSQVFLKDWRSPLLQTVTQKTQNINDNQLLQQQKPSNTNVVSNTSGTNGGGAATSGLGLGGSSGFKSFRFVQNTHFFSVNSNGTSLLTASGATCGQMKNYSRAESQQQSQQNQQQQQQQTTSMSPVNVRREFLYARHAWARKKQSGGKKNIQGLRQSFQFSSTGGELNSSDANQERTKTQQSGYSEEITNKDFKGSQSQQLLGQPTKQEQLAQSVIVNSSNIQRPNAGPQEQEELLNYDEAIKQVQEKYIKIADSK